MSTTTIKYSGLSLEIDYEFHRAYKGHGLEPDEPAYTSIDAIRWNGAEVMDLVVALDEESVENIATLIEDEADDRKTEYLISRREAS